MRNKISYAMLACLCVSARLLQAQDAGAAAASERLDASNRQMLWLAFSLYMAVLGIYTVWSESRLRRLEKSAHP